MKFNQEGLMNVFEKLLSSTRDLYIKGYIELKKNFGTIPDKKEYSEFISKIPNPRESSKVKRMDGYWEAKAFFAEDPYEIINVDSDSLCKSLDILAEERIKEMEEKEENKTKKKGKTKKCQKSKIQKTVAGEKELKEAQK